MSNLQQWIRTRQAPRPLEATSFAIRAGLMFLAALIALRRWSGATTAELPTAAALFVTICALALAVLTIRLDRRRGPLAPGMTLAAAIVLGGLLVPSGSTFGILGLIALTVAAIVVAVWMTNPREEARLASKPWHTDLTAEPELLESDASAVQEIVRRIEEGTELIEGRVRATFAAGEKQTVLHVPISPSLAAAPEVECGAEDDDVRVKVGTALPYGIRLELRRGDASSSAAVAVWFSISAPLHVADDAAA